MSTLASWIIALELRGGYSVWQRPPSATEEAFVFALLTAAPNEVASPPLPADEVRARCEALDATPSASLLERRCRVERRAALGCPGAGDAP